MKRILTSMILAALMVTGISAGKRSNIAVNGAGATFPYPIYLKWAYKYNRLTGVKVNYQSIGSGGGIAQIKAKTVDFGASDAPLKPDALNKFGLIQFPMIVGGVVPVVNLPGVSPGKLKLSPGVLAGIFMGEITRWDHPEIRKLNGKTNLPAKAITVVHRADGSGTTWIFTNYLSKVSTAWKDKVGAGKAVKWPAGVGGKGNEGVANYVRRIVGAIGYVEYAYALQNNLTYIRLANRDGNYVAPTIETFRAAAANADWKNAPAYYMVLTNQPGKDSWPITGASFILMRKRQQNERTAKAVLKFFDWCYCHGADMAKELHYVPIPRNVFELVEDAWKRELRAGGKPVWP